jgi:hypothetical protein
MRRHQLAIVLTVVVLGLTSTACDENRDCEARKPSIGLSFTLSGFEASEVHRLVLEIQIGKGQPKVFEVDGATALAEVFMGNARQGQITILLGNDKEEAKFAEREQLTVYSIKAYDADGKLLGESKPPDGPDTRGLTLDGCNFVDRVLEASGSNDGGVDGDGQGSLPSIATLATRLGTGSHAPSSIALCNVTGSDNVLDLVVGTPSAPGPNGQGAARGRVDILAGPLTDLSAVNQLEKVATFRIWGAKDGDELGKALLCTKLSGPSQWNDLVIGAPGAEGGRGHAYVHFGGDKPAQDIDLESGASMPVTFLGPPDGQRTDFGSSFAALGGWVTGTPVHSLAIGAPKLGLGGAAIIIGASPEWADPINHPAVIDAQGIAERERLTGATQDGALGAAISSDGDRVAIGSATGNVVEVWLRDATTGAWGLEQQIPGPTGETFGAAVALFNKTLVVGSPGFGGGAGQVSFYEYVNPQWKLTTTVLAPSNATGFGRAIAISSNHVVVGANDAAYSLLVGSKTATKLDSTIAAGSDYGRAVAVFDNTLRIAVGAPAASSGAGAVEVFSFDGTKNKFVKQEVFNGASGDEHLGTSVALFADTLAAGGPGVTNPGRVRVYRFDTTWQKPGLELLARDSKPQDSFGTSVALLHDHLLIGAPKAGDGGAAYVFRQAGYAWRPWAKLLSRGADPADELGASVAIFTPPAGGHTSYLVGDPGYDSGPSNVGSVALFGSGDTRVLTVLAETTNAQLGRSLGAGPVSSDGGDDLLIGASETKHNNAVAGAIFGLAALDLRSLPEPVTVVHTEFDQQHLTYWGAASSGFASSLAVGLVDGDGRADVLVGAPRRGAGGTLYLIRGDASLLTPTTQVHKVLDTEETTLVGYEGSPGSFLGERVFAIPRVGMRSGFLVTAPGHGNQRGAVYLLAGRDSYGSPEANDVTKHPDVVFAAEGALDSALLGSVAAGGELNNNQNPDLVLVATGENAIYLVLR